MTLGFTPSQNKALELLEDVACAFNILHFVIFIIIEVFVMFKIHFTSDKSTLVTLFVFTISLLMRFIIWILYLKNGLIPEDEDPGNQIIYMLDLLASIIIWAVLYYFIFEMRIVKDKL